LKLKFLIQIQIQIQRIFYTHSAQPHPPPNATRQIGRKPHGDAGCGPSEMSTNAASDSPDKDKGRLLSGLRTSFLKATYIWQIATK
jgi:hypothetical protein